ncbi:MAG: EamA family transporter [Candidatus Njordarchaeum guaymaensis]
MCALIVLLKLDQARREIDKKTLIIAMIGGIFGIGVGDWFFYLSLANIGASVTSALTTSSPLLSLFLAFILLKEKITWKQILGTILIIAGVLIISIGTLA